MKKRLLHLFALALCFAGTSLYASTIFSENFETVPAQLGVTTAGQFTAINGTNVDVVGPGNGWGWLVASPESGNAVDLGGTGGNPYGQLQSAAIYLAPGTYYLSFDLIGSQRGVTTTTDVTLGNLYNHSFTLASNDDASGIVNNALINVTNGEWVNLEFDLTNGEYNIGSLLDNVSITTTPEPGSLLLLGTGLTALAGLVRRRFGSHRA